MDKLRELLILILLLPSLHSWAVTVRTYSTVEEMVSDKNIKKGDLLETVDYYSTLKGGGGRYVVSKEVRKDEFSVQLKNGFYAVLQYEKELNVLKLGVKNNQSQDCSEIINNALDKLAEKGGILYFPVGRYLVSQINIKNSVKLRGDESSYWNQGTMFFCHSKKDMICIDAQNVHIENIFFVGNQNDNIAIKANGSQNRSGLRISNVHINKFKIGIETDHYFLSSITNSRTANCENGFVIKNATSFKLIQNWALVCGTGYDLSNSTYLDLDNCCSDECGGGYIIKDVKGININSCACEVSKEIPLYLKNATATISNFVGYKNNSEMRESTSLLLSENSTLVMIGCCDKDLYVSKLYLKSSPYSIKLVNSDLSIRGCVLNGSISKNRQSSASGSYVYKGQAKSL